jgi:hypothetical protein
LGERIDARRNVAIQSARYGGGAARAGDEEHRLVALDHRFSRADIAQP